MKLLAITTVLLPLSLALELQIQGKQYASQFLSPKHSRHTRKANMYWEYKESPWENLREYVKKNKEYMDLEESNVEYVESCTSEYSESYEKYDEKMEEVVNKEHRSGSRVKKPKYDCVSITRSDRSFEEWGRH